MKELFLHARQFAHEAGVASSDEAFAIADPCVVCQRPLDETSCDRLNSFDVFIEDKTTKAVDAAKAAIAARVIELDQLELFAKEEVLERVQEFLQYQETPSKLVDEITRTFTSLEGYRMAMVAQLKGAAEATTLPNVKSLA